MRARYWTLALVALVSALGCYANTEGEGPTEPEGPVTPPPAVPPEVSAVVTGYVLPTPDVPLWTWGVQVRAFGPDCASPIGISKGDDVGVGNEKGGATYRAVLRLTDTPAADGCVEITLIYQPDFTNPLPPLRSITTTVPVRFTPNGASPTATVYRADFHVNR